MAVKNVKVNIDINNNLKSVEDLKLELRALEAEFETVSVGSQRFNELGNQIKKTRSQLKDIDLQFEGLDKEQRATALVDTFQGLVGAVGAVSSAFIAFGAESKAIENAEKKLLGVIGVVSGLRDVSNGLVAANKLLGPTFEGIGTTIKAAFTTATGAVNGFRVALASIGIGLVVAGVVALVQNFDKLVPKTKTLADNLGYTNEELDRLSSETAKSTTEVELLSRTVIDQTKSEKERQKALDELSDKYPNYFGNLVKDINDTGALIIQKNKLIDTIIREARVRASKDKIEAIAAKNIGKRIQLQEQLTKAQDEENKTKAAANALLGESVKVGDKLRVISADEYDAQLQAAGATETYAAALQKSNAARFKTIDIKRQIANLDEQELKDAAVYQQIIDDNTAAIEENGGATKKTTTAKKEAVQVDKEALKAADELRKQQEQAAQIAAENADEVAEILLTARQKEIEDIKDANKEKFELLIKNYGIESQEVKNLTILQNKAIQEVNDKFDAEELAKTQEKEEKKKDIVTKISQAVAVSEEQKRIFEREQLTQYYDDLIAEATKFGLDITALNKAKNDALAKQNDEFNEEDTEKQKKYRENLQDLVVNSATSLIGDLKSLNNIYDQDNKEAAKRAFERNKSLSIVEAIISTYLAAQKAYTSQLTLTPDSPIRATIAAAVAVASGLARVAVIKAQKFDGDKGSDNAGGGGGTSTGNVARSSGGGTNILDPFATQGGGTNILPPRLAPPSGGQQGTRAGVDPTLGQVPVVRAYVLSGDVTDAQAADERLNQKRQL